MSQRIEWKMILFLCALAIGANSRAELAPKRSQESIIFQTNMGDWVMKVFPEDAPKNASQFIKLCKLNGYQGRRIFRSLPGFILQVDQIRGSGNLNAEKELKKLPLEAKALTHTRFKLSMAREDRDENSGESSFSILLGPAPHLDGKYTVFGEITQGEEVVNQMERIPTDPKTSRPILDIFIKNTLVLGEAELKNYKLNGAAPLNQDAIKKINTNQAEKTAKRRESINQDLKILLGISFGLALATLVLLLLKKTKLGLSVLLMSALLQIYLLFEVFYSEGPPEAEWVTTALFISFLAIIRLLGNFESRKT